MKSNKLMAIAISCILSLLPQIISAQSWDLIGNIVDDTSFLGTQNTKHLRIHTDNGNGYDSTKQRMIVTDSAGYVGIGTFDGTVMPTLPQNRLLVQSFYNW